MFQFPLLGNLLSGEIKGVPETESASTLDLQALMDAAGELPVSFASELQALLGSLEPDTARRLEGRLAGGMSLPQAARSVLGESLGRHTGMAPNPADAGILALSGDRPASPSAAPSAAEQGRSRSGGALVQVLRAGAEALPPSAPMNAAQASLAPLTPTPQAQFAPQLTANLLDMGVPQQVGAKGWGQAIADRVVWMVQGDQQTAKLKLNPPNLGPLEVRVSLNQDQASVAFVAQHAAVREALEAALPRLREMFEQHSLSLVRTDVSDPGGRHGGPAGGFASSMGGLDGGVDDGADQQAAETPQAGVSSLGNGLVDLFV